MKIFFDTEFTGLQKDTNLISIGLVDEDGKELYLEIIDIDISQVDNWIKENVLANTVYYGGKIETDIVLQAKDYHCCTQQQAKNILLDWLSSYDYVEFVSDVCHYDMVLLIDMFGTALDLPKNICPACHDINQDIADFLDITNYEAFDYNREDFLDDYNIVIAGEKHNSLYDARVIKAIYNILRG